MVVESLELAGAQPLRYQLVATCRRCLGLDSLWLRPEDELTALQRREDPESTIERLAYFQTRFRARIL